MSTAKAFTGVVPADYLTYEEAAAQLKIGRQALKMAIATGKLHPIKLQGIVRKFIARAEVESYHARDGRQGFIRESAPADVSETPELAQFRAAVAIAAPPVLDAIHKHEDASARNIESLTNMLLNLAVSSGLAVTSPKYQPNR